MKQRDITAEREGREMEEGRSGKERARSETGCR